MTAAQVAAFRLARHRIGGDGKASLASICRDAGGIQAQVMSAAEMALWTRRRDTTSQEIQAALWQRRELVKNDFTLYVTAVKPASTAILQRILGRIGARPAHVAAND